MFIFGANVDEVNVARKEMHNGRRDYVGTRLRRVFDTIRSGHFGDLSDVNGILSALENG